MQIQPRRKGAIRRSEIPPDVLNALNEGREETITLVEWLAIDMRTLLRSIAPDVGLSDALGQLEEAYGPLARQGVTVRLKGVGAALWDVSRGRPDRNQVFENLASHKSDMVRGWAAFMLAADQDTPLAERLEATRRFAADRSVAVRELAWDSFRPYVADELSVGFELLKTWVRDTDPNIRRCAVEGTRPRGVRTAHIEALKEDPSPGLSLLEPVRSDPSRSTSSGRSPTGSTTPASRARTGFARYARAGPGSLLPRRRPGPFTMLCGPCARWKGGSVAVSQMLPEMSGRRGTWRKPLAGVPDAYQRPSHPV